MYHVDLKLLRSFASVASECSVTRAAERLNLTQPTVSGQIKELEQSLGFSLFERTTRQISLTAEGSMFLPAVESLLRQAAEVREHAERMQDQMRRRFRLGAAMYTMDMPDRIEMLDAFGAARPDIRFSVDNRLQTDQVRDLLSGKLDAALLLGIAVDMRPAEFLCDLHPGEIANEVLVPAQLERLLLRRQPIGLLVPEGSELARHEIIPRDALAGQQVAMLSAEHGERFVNPIANFLLSYGAKPLVLAEGNALAVERYAQRNQMLALGINWFPTLDGMVRRPVEDMDFYLDLSLVLGTAPNTAARRFFDFVSEWQAQRSQQPERRAAASGSAPRLKMVR
ncbi:MAG: LysR family transcriptional regulator [Novosphingobium sp.]